MPALEPPSSNSVQILNPFGYPYDSDRIARAAVVCLDLESAPPSDVRVLLTDDEAVRELNRKFRDIDRSTDVLTFPEEQGASGDIAISVPYAERQARAHGIDPQDEIVLLAIHGVLHLVGLDDETEPERTEMIRRMYRIAAELGVPCYENWPMGAPA
jgi:rRNA maturation RNase YbeY